MCKLRIAFEAQVVIKSLPQEQPNLVLQLGTAKGAGSLYTNKTVLLLK